MVEPSGVTVAAAFLMAVSAVSSCCLSASALGERGSYWPCGTLVAAFSLPTNQNLTLDFLNSTGQYKKCANPKP